MFIANQVDDAAMGATKSYTDFLQARTVPFVYVFVLPFPCFHCFQAVWWQQSPAEACRSSCWDGLEPPATGVPAARCGVTLLLPAAPTVPNPTPGRCLQTRLSLNGGGDWQPLSRPERFTNPQCNTCKPGAPDNQCRLHLHGPTSWFAPEGEGPLRLSLWLHVERAVPAQGGRHGCQGMDAVWRAVGGTHGQRFVGHGGQRAGRCPYQRPSAQRALGAASRRAHPCLLCVPPLVCMHGPSSLVPPPRRPPPQLLLPRGHPRPGDRHRQRGPAPGLQERRHVHLPVARRRPVLGGRCRLCRWVLTILLFWLTMLSPLQSPGCPSVVGPARALPPAERRRGAGGLLQRAVKLCGARSTSALPRLLSSHAVMQASSSMGAAVTPPRAAELPCMVPHPLRALTLQAFMSLATTAASS